MNGDSLGTGLGFLCGTYAGTETSKTDVDVQGVVRLRPLNRVDDRTSADFGESTLVQYVIL